MIALYPEVFAGHKVKGIVEIQEQVHPKLRQKLDSYGLYDTKIFSSAEKALQTIPKEEAEAVLIVTPNATHADYVELCLKYDRHVFLEKPIATTTILCICQLWHSCGRSPVSKELKRWKMVPNGKDSILQWGCMPTGGGPAKSTKHLMEL